MRDELKARVGYLTACGRPQKLIAQELQISTHRVSRLQLSLGMRRRLKLTQRARAKREKLVRKMTRARVTQDKIAKRTGMSRVGVYKCQQRLGLRQFTNRDLSPKKQRQIIALLRARVPACRIMLALGVGRNIILRFRGKRKSNG